MLHLDRGTDGHQADLLRNGRSFPCKPKPRTKAARNDIQRCSTTTQKGFTQTSGRRKPEQEQSQRQHLNLETTLSRSSHIFQLLHTALTMFFSKKMLMTGKADQINDVSHYAVSSSVSPRAPSPLSTDFQTLSREQRAFPASGSQKWPKPLQNRSI